MHKTHILYVSYYCYYLAATYTASFATVGQKRLSLSWYCY